MADIRISSVIVGELSVNCWFLANEDTKEILVFDPGDDAERIQRYVDQNKWKVRAILLTHGHSDHMGAAGELKKLWDVPVYAMGEEEALLLDAKKNLSIFIQRRPITLTADRFLSDGEEFSLAGLQLKAYLTPGHTPGGGAYYCPEAKAVFSGDTLFAGSVGRSDFPGGSMSALIRSVKEKLFLLPDDTVVYPGHGETTGIGEEKRGNPYIQ